MFGVVSRSVAMMSVALLAAACTGTDDGARWEPIPTPTVDYVERLDVYSAPHKDSFLNQLAMNYRSYAIYNARTSGYSEMGELFARKAVSAFSGETPFPETLDAWPVDDNRLGFELHNAYNSLIEELKNDAADKNPNLAAEAQAKFDCWLSASASGQVETAKECRVRFEKALAVLRNCSDGKVIEKTKTVSTNQKRTAVTTARTESYYPETRRMSAMHGAGQQRDGMIIVNNVNIPTNLINPVPVQPMVFNQNIYGGDKTITKTNDSPAPQMIGEEMVTREEFINIMMALRSELQAINDRLDKIEATAGEKTMIKVQQIPLEPKQHVMEEIFEVRFDFNKSVIKPEYQALIRKLVEATRENRNVKISVVGHTDTAGSTSYNYALGGRRAEAVAKMLVEYGIPASQIVAVSSGEKDNKVPTGDGVPNAENRRVRVVKEVHYDGPIEPMPTMIEVEEYSMKSCGRYGCKK